MDFSAHVPFLSKLLEHKNLSVAYSVLFIETYLSSPVNRREYLRNWWDLSRGANVLWGCSTIVLGTVLIGIKDGNVLIPLTLHAFCIGAFIAGWFAINDLLDIDIDRVNHPQRPLPSENISEIAAKKYGYRMIILSAVSLIAIIMNEPNFSELAWLDSVAVWLVALLIMIAYELDGPYNPALKKRIVWGNLAIASTVAITILFGAAAIDHFTDPLLWLVAAAAMTLTTAREIIMDTNDQDGDYNRNTLPKALGNEKARRTVWILAIASALLLSLPFALGYLPQNLIVFVLPSIASSFAVKPFLKKGKDNEAGHVLRAAMVFGLLGLALCGMIINH